MRVMRLPDVDQGQHHEHERLQGNDQDVEHCPRPTRHHVQQQQHQACGLERKRPRATQQGNQHEHQLPCIHVAKQPHAMRHRLGDKRDQLFGDIHDGQNDGKHGILAGAEWCRYQLMRPTANTLDFDVVDQACLLYTSRCV